MADKLFHVDWRWAGGQTFRCSIYAETMEAASLKAATDVVSLLERFGQPLVFHIEDADTLKAPGKDNSDG